MNRAMREAEKQLAEQAEISYKPTRARPASRSSQRRKWARARHRSAHKVGPRRAKLRGRLKAPDVCASLRQSPAPTNKPNPSRQRRQPSATTSAAQIASIGMPIRPASDRNRAHRSRSEALRDRPPTDNTPENALYTPLTFIGRQTRVSSAGPVPTRTGAIAQRRGGAVEAVAHDCSQWRSRRK